MKDVDVSTGRATLDEKAGEVVDIRYPSNQDSRDFGAPLLSVLCLTYNHEQYISQALDSFLMQETLFPFEIVVGEDCSTDGTFSVVMGYQRRFPEIIRVVASENNAGVTENFKRTLNSCRGRYIAICEGDDYWTDNRKLQIQVEFMEKESRYVMTYHDAYVFNESGIVQKRQLPKPYQCDASGRELIGTRPISTLTTCFRNVLQEIPAEFDNAPILDLCIWSLLGNYGDGKYLGDINPAAYRMHSGGIMSSQSEVNKIRATMRTYECLAQYYARQNNLEISREFTFKIASLAASESGYFGKLKLLASHVDRFFGYPLYSIKRHLTGR